MMPREERQLNKYNPGLIYDVGMNNGDDTAYYLRRGFRVIAIEPNPPIYGTNFINTTEEAFALCRALNHPGLNVNLDTGTLLHDGDAPSLLTGNIALVNHVHLSEPYLAPLERRAFHRELRDVLRSLHFGNYVSIEMRTQADPASVKSIALYVKDLFHAVS